MNALKKLEKSSDKSDHVKTPPPKTLSFWGKKIYEVTHNGFKFYACTQYGNIYVGDETMHWTDQSTIKGAYYFDMGPNNYKAKIPISLSSDQSCAYSRYHPKFLYCKTADGPEHKSPKDYVPALDWVLANYLRIPDGTTCYLTKHDGDPKILLKALKDRGFYHTATNRSSHTGRYPVYLLVHPGDRKKIKTKPEQLPDADDESTEEF